VIYLDDRILTHPKLIRAGQLIGRNGVSRALHLYITGLAYAQAYITDGFVNDALITRYAFDNDPLRVAKALANESVRLWHRVEGGYQIHDYHEYNDDAAKVERKKALTRARVARWRSRHNRLGETEFRHS
jgi:hypothetical protein